MLEKIKKLNTICKACGECMAVETSDGVFLRCTEYNNSHTINKSVLKCSSFYLDRDTRENLTKKESKEIDTYFKLVFI